MPIRIALLIGVFCLLGADVSAGEATNKPASINATHCVCKIEACCLCVGETLSNALTVTLTSEGAESGGYTYKVLLIECAEPSTLPGPRFENKDGTTVSAPILCDGNPNKFNIYAGEAPGEYKVFIKWEKDGKGECVECGTICVFSIDRKNYVVEEECNKFPAGYSQPDGRGVFEQLQSNGWSYEGPLCGIGANEEIKDINPFSSPPYGRIWENGVPKDEFVQKGEPYTHLPGNGPPGDRFDNPCVDDCGNRIELFCNGSEFNIYFVDCFNNYYLIGHCEWAVANNILSTTKTKCEGKERFIMIKFENIEGTIINGEFVATGNFNKFTFDSCTKQRLYIRKGPKPQAPPNPPKVEVTVEFQGTEGPLSPPQK